MWGPCEEIFLFFFLPLSFLRVLRCILLSSWVACPHRQSKIKFFPTIFFLSFFLSDREIQIPIQFSLSLSLSHSSLKKNAPPNAAPVPAFRARSIDRESLRYVASRDPDYSFTAQKRKRKKKWRTFCSHRGCARVRDGTRTGNPSIRPPP